MKFVLKQTCFACPEQYDVFYGEEQVGYLRLRYGVFTCLYPDESGEKIYEAYPKGDGCFEENERDEYIKTALNKIKEKMLEIKYEVYKW